MGEDEKLERKSDTFHRLNYPQEDKDRFVTLYFVVYLP